MKEAKPFNTAFQESRVFGNSLFPLFYWQTTKTIDSQVSLRFCFGTLMGAGVGFILFCGGKPQYPEPSIGSVEPSALRWLQMRLSLLFGSGTFVLRLIRNDEYSHYR